MGEVISPQGASMWTRRELLRVGGLGPFGLSLPHLLAADEKQKPLAGSKADACIILFLNGGPSHLDMWDMKPLAPTEFRGEFKPINTSLPGVQLCEHLPRSAKLMNRVTLVRSMHHSVNNSHAAAVYAAMTGHDRGEQGGGARPTDHPSPGAVLGKLRPVADTSLPYVALPYKTKEGAGGPLQPGFLSGFIGASYDPFWVLEDPNAPNFHLRDLAPPEGISLERIQGRSRLLSQLDHRLGRQHERSLTAMNDFQRRAFDILSSATTRQAFELTRETDADRERYGRNIYGQSVLLSRRLIEAGTRTVTVSWAPDANATWDTHGSNFVTLKNSLLPAFDAAFSSLLEDLSQSGRLERTLVAVLGDFGRTPRINNNNGGRDHWNSCYSVMLCGGGIREGYIHGASDRTGAVPIEAPVTPGDIIATMYHLLGVDHSQMLYDSLARPQAIVPEGRVVHQLLG